MAAVLLGARMGAITFAKGAIAAIDFDGPIEIGQGELRGSPRPKRWAVDAIASGPSVLPCSRSARSAAQKP